ncbi:MAG: hypothetical protein EA384_14715 [Spirochaetaceae bacterium]|nr:MAG: hypothetical protein EA384_14715 [Spirochaetaceae bacterium]
MSDRVIEVVKRSNQRGGRMLSLVDLIEANTLTSAQAAWLTERLENGASFLVGAVPGGAGKTAVMGALITMLPADETVHVTLSGSSGWRQAGPGACLVAYEISPASYEGYIWGEELRTFMQRGLEGARLVANLHADDPVRARRQLVDDNAVAPAAFDSFELFIPITVGAASTGYSRVIEQIALRDTEGWSSIERHPELSPRAREIAAFLDDCAASGIRRIEAVRERWLQR